MSAADRFIVFTMSAAAGLVGFLAGWALCAWWGLT
jgi:hypothetical protein